MIAFVVGIILGGFVGASTVVVLVIADAIREENKFRIPSRRYW